MIKILEKFIVLMLVLIVIMFLCSCASKKKVTESTEQVRVEHVQSVDSVAREATRDSVSVRVQRDSVATASERYLQELLKEKDSVVIYEHSDGTRDVERHHVRSREVLNGEKASEQKQSIVEDTVKQEQHVQEVEQYLAKIDSLESIEKNEMIEKVRYRYGWSIVIALGIILAILLLAWRIGK